jgi:citrate synthase
VYVDHVGAAVVAVEGCAEGGAPEEVAEVLMEMRDEETIAKELMCVGVLQ